MQFDESLDKFTVNVEGNICCRPCLNFVFFAPTLQTQLDLSEPYTAFVRRFDSLLKWYRNDGDQMHAKSLPVEHRSDWHLKTKRELANAKDGVYIELRATSVIDEWLPPALTLSSSRIPWADMQLHISLPISWLEEEGAPGVDAFIDDILGNDFPFAFGYVGLGLCWKEFSVTKPSILFPLFNEWLKEHPGLTRGDPIGQIYPARNGLVDIGWITLLGADYAQKIGQTEGIMSGIDAEYKNDVQVRPLVNGGVAIKAGHQPQLGSISKGNRLDVQCAVGRSLRSLWDGEKNKVQVVSGFVTTEGFVEQGKWANRFFV